MPGLLDGLFQEGSAALGIGQGGAGQGPVGRDRRDEVAVEGLLLRKPGGGPVQGRPVRRLAPGGSVQPVEDPCSHVARRAQGRQIAAGGVAPQLRRQEGVDLPSCGGGQGGQGLAQLGLGGGDLGPPVLQQGVIVHEGPGQVPARRLGGQHVGAPDHHRLARRKAVALGQGAGYGQGVPDGDQNS